MSKGSRAGRIAARAAWEAVKVYLRVSGDKTGTFTSKMLRQVGVHGYAGKGLNRLLSKEVIEKVGEVRLGRDYYENVYALGEKLRKYPVEEIVGFSYMKVAGR